MPRTLSKPKTARTVRVEETDDYNQFVTLKGNRRTNPRHVKRLIKKMVEEGNLTQIFPIVVNERMEVIDGQHRLEALRQLGWPVFYEVKSNLTIETVEALNTGTQNWTWFDYAFSFSERGNDNYTRFLSLWDYFNLPYHVIYTYVSGRGTGGSKSQGFREGKLQLTNHKESFNLLKQYKEVSEAAKHQSSGFARAMLDVMRLPSYDHQRMVKKMAKYGGELQRYTQKEDYMRAIETIYNTYVHEDERVRLF